MTRLFRLTLLVLILFSAFTLSAQGDAIIGECDFGLINAIRDLKRAQAEAQDNNVESARLIVEIVQTQLSNYLESCEAQAIDLPQTITSNDEISGIQLIVHYPDGWVAEDLSGMILLAESQETLDIANNQPDTGTELSEDTIILGIITLDSEILSYLYEDDEVVTDESVLESLFLAGDNDGINFEPVQIEFLNGRRAATLIAVGTNPDELIRVFAVSLEINNIYLVFGAYTNVDETDFDDTVRAIAASVQATFIPLDNEG